MTEPTTASDPRLPTGVIAYALALESPAATAWQRADGSIRTDYRRRIRGVEIEVRIEREPWHPDAFAALIQVRLEQTGLVYEEFYDRRLLVRTVTVDVPGAWKDVLGEAFRSMLSPKEVTHGRP